MIKNPVDDPAYGLINSPAIDKILVIRRIIRNVEREPAAPVPFRGNPPLQKY